MLEIMQDYGVSIACFFVVILCLFQTWILKKDFFRPGNIYVFTQALTLGVAYLQLNTAMSDFRPLTWIVWIGAMVSFLLGTLTFSLVYPKDQAFKDSSKKWLPDTMEKKYDWYKHFYLTLFLFGVFLLGVIGMVAKVGTLIVFAKDVTKWVSSEANYGVFSIFVMSSPLVVLFSGVASFKSINPYKLIRISCIAISFVTVVLALLAYPSRTSLFLSVGILFILFNYLKKKISVSFIVVTLFLAVALFISVAVVRSQYGGRSLEGMAIDRVVSIPYDYVANNYWNLDFMLNPMSDREKHPFTYGIDAFHGVFEFTMLPGLIRNYYGWDNAFNKSVQKIPGYNTTGYLWEVYKDWGIFGVALFPFCIAFLISFLYEKVRRTKTPLLWMLYALFLYHLGWWFFTAGYKSGLFWLWIYAIFIFGKLCEKRIVSKIKETKHDKVLVE